MPPPITYDPLAPATLDDPYPVFAALRETAPVSWHAEMNSWLVTRYDDCVVVLRDHRRFARDRRRAGVEVPAASLSVQSLDPPGQARVRSLFMSALHAQDLDAIQARARSLLLARFEQLTSGGAFDVMVDVATPWPWRSSPIYSVSRHQNTAPSPESPMRSCAAWTAGWTRHSSSRAASPVSS